MSPDIKYLIISWSIILLIVILAIKNVANENPIMASIYTLAGMAIPMNAILTIYIYPKSIMIFISIIVISIIILLIYSLIKPSATKPQTEIKQTEPIKKRRIIYQEAHYYSNGTGINEKRVYVNGKVYTARGLSTKPDSILTNNLEEQLASDYDKPEYYRFSDDLDDSVDNYRNNKYGALLWYIGDLWQDSGENVKNDIPFETTVQKIVAAEKQMIADNAKPLVPTSETLPELPDKLWSNTYYDDGTHEYIIHKRICLSPTYHFYYTDKSDKSAPLMDAEFIDTNQKQSENSKQQNIKQPTPLAQNNEKPVQPKKTTEQLRREYERSLMTPSLRYEILRRDGFRCKLCGRTAEDGIKLHVDHIIPIAKGGKTIKSNLRTLCQDCNLGKGAKIE